MSKKINLLVIVVTLFALALTACQPQVVVETKEVVVEKTVVVTQEVEVEVEKTVVVEVEAQPEATPVPATSGEPVRLAVLLGGLINDGGFNTIGYSAIVDAQKNLGAETTYIEAVDAADAAGLMSKYANDGYDVVYAYSGKYQATVFQVAPEHPETTFVAMAGPDVVESAPDNVWISGNAFEDAFYLAGALAGLMTKTNTLGYVGGAEIPVYKASAKSFEEGAKSVNPDVTVFVTFTGNMDDALAAKEATTGQIENGADIVMAAVNHGLFGVTAAAEAKEGIKVIGMSADQKTLAPNVILTSILMDYSGVMQEILKQVQAGVLGGYAPINLASGRAGLAPYYGEVPDDIAQKIEEIKQQLINGEIDYTTAADL